jgi:hypothetical protein
MASLNGRYIKLNKEEGQPVCLVNSWTLERDWMKVKDQNGASYMVHYTDNFEVMPATYSPESNVDTVGSTIGLFLCIAAVYAWDWILFGAVHV